MILLVKCRYCNNTNADEGFWITDAQEGMRNVTCKKCLMDYWIPLEWVKLNYGFEWYDCCD